LQQELGAEVSHFDQLNGVRVAGKAYLTSETALHYLANFGAVLNPIGLTITVSKSKEQSSQLVNKLLFVALGIAVVVMGTLSALKLVKYFGLKTAERLIEEDIAQMEDIEQIAQEYEKSVESYKIVKNFADGTVSDNEMVYQFVCDLEGILPSNAYINSFDSQDGIVTLELTTSEKDAVADVIVKVKELDYVQSVMLSDGSDEFAEYALHITDPGENEVFSINGQEYENIEDFDRPVIFPLEIHLKNSQGTAISDEVAAALAGVTTVPDADAAPAAAEGGEE
jgi:hypothetical protein